MTPRAEPSAPRPPKARMADVFTLVSDPDVTDAEIRYWLWLRRHHIDERGAYVSDEATARGLGWSERKIQEVRARLVVHRLLHVVLRGPAPPARYPLPHANGSHGAGRQESRSHVTQETRPPVTQFPPASHDEPHHVSHLRVPAIEDVEPGNREAGDTTSLVELTLDAGDCPRPAEILPSRNGDGKRSGSFQAIQAHLARVLEDVSAGRLGRLKVDEMRTVQAQLIFAYWQAEYGHERALLDDKRLNRLKRCLVENGGNVHELLWAVKGWRYDPTFQRLKDDGRVLDGIENIFSDRARIERLSNQCKKWRESQAPHPMAVKYLEGLGT